MSLGPEELYEFDATGLVVLRGAVAPALVERARQALERMEGTRSEDLPDGCFASWTPVLDEYSILNVLEADPVFLDFVDQSAILHWIDALVPAPYRLVEAFTNSRRRGVGLPLHAISTASYSAKRGQPRSNHVTAFVALTPIGPDDGPPIVFQGTHKLDVPFPYRHVHPDWPVPEHDRAVREAILQREAVRIARRWEEIPGYREILLEPGDVLLFTEDLVHGAKAIRSDRERRALILAYSPYHFANWHGVRFSEGLLQRAGPRQRELLAGPFIGNVYEDGPARHIAPSAFHPPIPHTDRPHRLHDRDVCSEVGRRFARAAAAYDPGSPAAGPLAGRVRFEVAGSPGWTVEVDPGSRELRLLAGGSASPDAVVEADPADLAAILARAADANELFHHGRIRLRGNVALAMQVVSVVIG